MKSCSENMQQIYKRKPMPKCDFKIALWHGCSPVNLLHIFRIPKNTSGRLILKDLETDINYALGEFVITLMEVTGTVYLFLLD